MLTPADWTAIWYRCLVCQRCFQFPDRLLTHKRVTECGIKYQNFLPWLETRDEEDKALLNRVQNTRAAIIDDISISSDSTNGEAETIKCTSASSASSTIDSLDLPSSTVPLPSASTTSADTVRVTEEKPCSSSSNIQQSVKSTPKSSPGRCYFCKKKCKYPSDLEKHLRVHTDERPYRCKKCGSIFSYKDTLSIHIRNAHSQRIKKSTQNYGSSSASATTVQESSHSNSKSKAKTEVSTRLTRARQLSMKSPDTRQKTNP